MTVGVGCGDDLLFGPIIGCFDLDRSCYQPPALQQRREPFSLGWSVVVRHEALAPETLPIIRSLRSSLLPSGC
jgi:hypothetical protein